ncbi:hypothetical protein ACFODZ_01310 [Marinicella sediminis]|uniref:Uncharacterized protein n=1 Tax=Marinicella sediminis TaxID=1792834 RepID=A0ABV7JBP9_9GAMM|nr:hypothetical protein [Marinicella sediminis]
MKNLTFLLFTILMWSCLTATADDQPIESGDVRVNLQHYIQLIEAARDPQLPAPVAYAIGQADLEVQLTEQPDRTNARIKLQTTLEVFADEWTVVPLLPVGTAISLVAIDGRPVQLTQRAEWLSWSTRQSGTYTLLLEYAIDAVRSQQGYVLPVPVPRSSSAALRLNYTGDPLDVAVIPATAVQSGQAGEQQQITARIPSTTALLLTWRVPEQSGYVISRANYAGEWHDDALTLVADYQVDVLSGEQMQLPVLANTVVLHDVHIDGQPATVLNKDDHFQVMLQGRGMHQIQVTFQVPVEQHSGPPKVVIPTPEVAISAFSLQLPGRKEVSFFPATQVTSEQQDEHTIARGFVPLTNEVEISWIDAVPNDMATGWRANANIYHAFSAEEGVLYGRGLLDYEITQGETSVLSFTVPADSQINRLSSQTAAVSDWQESVDGELKTITVYLDRKVNGAFQLQLAYEQLLATSGGEGQPGVAIKVPLIKALEMHRQRGIVALLVGQELTLKPVNEQGVTRVGENQIPAIFRDQIAQTIAHTFKYAIELPQLSVITMAPERQQGKYDAQVDTLISLGEVTLRGSAGIRLDVKSGSLVAVSLSLPEGVNVLNVSGPSIRQHRIVDQQDQQHIEVEFTQEMKGQFQLEVNYEHILSDQQSAVAVPTITVGGAEVQHGRIAVEALTAVEIQATKTKHLSTLAINELPQQLVLKTTNPILLSYKYVNADQPHQLSLSMTRHEELAVQVAAIETARYQTLITSDGLAVTTARFQVRNSRQQFLRLSLPAGSDVWSVFVDGQAEKPARAGAHGAGTDHDILIKMLNATTGFPVEVIYATPLDSLGLMGQIQARLPQPDMVVTQSEWDVFLPQGPDYYGIDSNLQVRLQNRQVNPRALTAESMADRRHQPLRLQVPQQGVQFSFEKLYANQSSDAAYVHIRYAAAEASRGGQVISVLSVLLIWLAIFAMHSGRFGWPVLAPVLLAGSMGLIGSLGFLPASPVVPLVLILIGGVMFVIHLVWPRLRRRA